MVKKLNINWKSLVVYAVLGVAVGVANPLICDSQSPLANTFLARILTDFTAFTIIGCLIIRWCVRKFNINTATFATWVFFLAYTPVYYVVEANTAQYAMGGPDRYIIWGVITLLTLPGAWVVAHFKEHTKLGIIARVLPLVVMVLMLVDYISAIVTARPYVVMCGTEVGCQFHASDTFILIQRIITVAIAIGFIIWWRIGYPKAPSKVLAEYASQG